jgi:transposase
MAKPYSEDLRRRVVEAIDSGATIPDAAEQCGVSISSVVRFLRLQRETGSVSGAKFGGYKEFALAAHEELVRSLIEEQPDITLAELETRLAKKKVLVGKSSISRFLDHLELPFKKKLLGEVVWVILDQLRTAVFFCCCRCGHVGNALALSIMSIAVAGCSRRGFVMEPCPRRLVRQGASRPMVRMPEAATGPAACR